MKEVSQKTIEKACTELLFIYSHSLAEMADISTIEVQETTPSATGFRVRWTTNNGSNLGAYINLEDYNDY